MSKNNEMWKTLHEQCILRLQTNTIFKWKYSIKYASNNLYHFPRIFLIISLHHKQKDVLKVQKLLSIPEKSRSTNVIDEIFFKS